MIPINKTEDANSTTSKSGNFSRLALVLQAVLLNLTLYQVEGSENHAVSLVGPNFWDELYYPSKTVYPAQDYYPEHPWYRNERPYGDNTKHAGYDTAAGYGGWYGKNTGGERGWSQGRHDARRHGQVSSGFSNSYSKNEKGDSTVYYHDDLAKSANLDYTGLGSRYRGNGGGYDHGRHSDHGATVRTYPDQHSNWYYPPYGAYDRVSRFHVPIKKTSLYVVPPPRKYFIDKPSS